MEQVDDVTMAVVAEFTARLGGRCAFDGHHRGLYATDASLYQVTPLGVVWPESDEDCRAAVELCGRHGLAMLPRGGGTSLAGQGVNRAIVIDFSRHRRGMSAVDVAARTVVAQAGAVVDDLNGAIAGTGLFFAADPATSAQAAVGGCIGNNAAGARSIRYGRTVENVAGIDLLLADGRAARLGAEAGRADAVARELAAAVIAIIGPHVELIRSRFPKTPRRNAGYALDMIADQLAAGATAETLDLVPLICGSEGTLGIVLSATLKLHPIPFLRGLAIASYASVDEAIAAVGAILQTKPSAVELLDEAVLAAAMGNARCREYVELLPKIGGSAPAAALYVEYQAERGAGAERDAAAVRGDGDERGNDTGTGAERERGDGTERDDAAVRDAVRDDTAVRGNDTGDGPERGAGEIAAGFARLRAVIGAGTPLVCHEDQAAMMSAWALRKAGEPLLHGLPGKRKPITFVEDCAVPVENLGRFVTEFRRIVTEHGTVAAFWAHASVGVLHVRPMLDVHDPADRTRLRSIAVTVADLARDCGGVMSGEHGDGRARGPLLERYFGAEVIDLFAAVKRVFDPRNLMNPGDIVDAGPVASITENLRLDHQRVGRAGMDGIETFFDYADQHGFGGAVEMCNGAGVCRRSAGGTMCPSYRATLDERHATRGRGNALRLAITGQIGSAGGPLWDDPDTLATLDWCLSCKACKSECPSNVDIARLKAEYTAQGYAHGRRVPLNARVFGHVRTLNAIGSALAPLSNWINRIGVVRGMANRLLRLAPERSLPTFAPSLGRWMKKRRGPADSRPVVALFGDCFTLHNEPHIGRAAVGVLEALGYRVELADAGCCGRSMISMGLLPAAIATADRTIGRLRKWIEDPNVVAIAVVEPSCLSAMTDDWLKLKLRSPMDLRRALANKAVAVEAFVQRDWTRHPNRPAMRWNAGAVLVHGHCHQKALGGLSDSAAALRRVAGERVRVLETGCCGMAGAFGFDAGRYELSMRIGEMALLPAARSAGPDDWIVASGTSCRHQILDGTARQAHHPIELLAAGMRTNG